VAKRPSVAVLSVTRDRLGYSKHCFAQLRKNAGIAFDHYVFDNGSQDGTQDWLKKRKLAGLILSDSNTGVTRALNQLLDLAEGYDAYVKFDNDCELTTHGALRDAVKVVTENPLWLVSPKIEGLYGPVGHQDEVNLSGHRVGVTPMIGGIFSARSKDFQYRYDESAPLWGFDDVAICGEAHRRGGQTGYLLDHIAWHYEGTWGQEKRYHDYFVRKHAEMGNVWP
jgi:GT2 family glycosyltransferase